MHVLHPVCGGIDGHAAPLTAGLRRVSDDGQSTTALVDCGTTSRALIALRTWLHEQPCPVVALERTGVSWKPVYHVVSEAVEVCGATSQDVRQRPGKNTDKRDAPGIAELLAPGLITPSCVPPPEMRALRDLTRTRVSLMPTRPHAKNRVTKIVEDTTITLARVVSEVCGKSARRMVEALVDVLGRQIGERDQQFHELLGPLAPQREQLDSIPGVNAITARDMLAEMGVDMTRCGSASRLAAWAGVSPGTNESAGKRRQGRTRRGNRSLRRVVVPWAWATRKTATLLGRTCRRLEARVGGTKAAVAVAHKLLVILYHLLLEGTVYEEERYDRLVPRQEARERKRALKARERLG